MHQRLASPTIPSPATIVSVSRGIYRHVGLVTDRHRDGMPMVIANAASTSGVAEISWDEFSEGKVVQVEGFPGTVPATTALARVRSKIGTPYNLLNWNCEHLVRYAHDLPPKSPQLALAAMGLLAALFLARA